MMKNYQASFDCLNAYLWENYVGRYCDRKFNKDQQILIVNLVQLESELFDICFSKFCLILKIYISLQRENVTVQYNRSYERRDKIIYCGCYYSFSNLEECDPKYVKAFLSYFKSAVEVIESKYAKRMEKKEDSETEDSENDIAEDFF